MLVECDSEDSRESCQYPGGGRSYARERTCNEHEVCMTVTSSPSTMNMTLVMVDLFYCALHIHVHTHSSPLGTYLMSANERSSNTKFHSQITQKFRVGLHRDASNKCTIVKLPRILNNFSCRSPTSCLIGPIWGQKS